MQCFTAVSEQGWKERQYDRKPRMPVIPKKHAAVLMLTQLENMVAKMQMQSPNFSELDFRVYPRGNSSSSYMIDISRGRFSQSVVVDPGTVRRIETGQSDANLLREIRNAMLSISRWSKPDDD